ncbi:MAG: tRNA (adenosine(37)-N6)-threonylcarbamoyltransferase complex ATPase subunit type 1 TsaE [Gemmatimonadota bacterium]|jgi:tRNA threonylcarbamoyladenosine biosynthesis protein TsaE|nr:tRNA (adenosine(37)-N6)-threonylcarbamoyltransferase complex ATPase subunit type 1 TsaE [Gemmatimonadota bacterium]
MKSEAVKTLQEFELDEDALMEWGKVVGSTATVPLVVALRGDLGAGKTTFARAVARGAGLVGPIPSPTYNLLFRYEAPRGISFVHIDLYRLEHENDVWELGWSDLPGAGDMVVIEWPSRAESLLPSPRWELSFRETEDGEARRIRLTPVGDPAMIPLPESRG